MLQTFADALDDSSIGQAIAGSRIVFPLIEGTHLFGLTLAIGLIFLIDLRLIGVYLRHVPFEDLLRQLRPYVLVGNILVFITGFLLVWAESSVIFAPSFPIKLALIGIAGINALYFEFVTSKKTVIPTDSAPMPTAARAAGWVSLSVWVLVIICGRLIAYVPTWP